MSKTNITLTINGAEVSAEVEPRTLLIHFLREGLDITGPHIGCETSHCGACTVDLDGKSVKSCTLFAVQADGAELTTVKAQPSAARCIRFRKASSRSTACNAAFARRAC